MNAIGGQEFLGPEAMMVTASELRSYKQLPQIWYRIADLMLDSRSFELVRETMPMHSDAFGRILDRCGVQYSASQTRFVAGHDKHLESLEPRPPQIDDPEGDLQPEEFHTPGQRTIADVAAFTGLPETSQIKSLVLVGDGKPVLVLLRGDHSLSEPKLKAHLSIRNVRGARHEEIREWFGAEAGSLGPINVKNMNVLADTGLEGRRNMICGANRTDYHLRNVTPGEDFEAEWVELRETPDERALLAKLGTRFFRPSGLLVTGQTGELQPLIRGFFQLYLDRILDALVDQNHDKDGIALPTSIAPFNAIVTPVNFADPSQQDAARKLYQALIDQGVDALLDDRDERPGVKFKDADLIGVPYRITIGKKLPQGLVELVNRRTHESSDIKIEEAAPLIASQIK
ncbi:MAG TPA: YbaK/EbsC family protein [Bryobacteraceae bacterium]|nr:YbaK/EbsC family protein [Bryobacteraceae bacterium]